MTKKRRNQNLFVEHLEATEKILDELMKDGDGKKDKLKHVLPLRLVSKILKQVVDNYGKVWRCFDGGQLLMFPTIVGDVNNIKWLVAQGADVNERGLLSCWTSDSWFPEDDEEADLYLAPNPLDLAARYGIVESAEALLEHGAEMTPRDAVLAQMDLPIHHAAKGGHLPIINLLLSKGMNINARGAAALTALHIAAGLGLKKVVRLLIRKEADVNTIDCEGRTPVAFALDNNKEPMARLIRSHGGKKIDPNGLVPNLPYYCKPCDRIVYCDEIGWTEHKGAHPNWDPKWDKVNSDEEMGMAELCDACDDLSDCDSIPALISI